ncbi:MAG: cupredoxin domain-containing protein [Halolamina sp.]
MDRREFIAALGVLTAGCAGGSGGSGDAATDSPTESPTPTPTETPAGTVSPTPTATPAETAREAYPEYDWSIVDGADPVATTTVRMQGFEFAPTVAAFEPDTEVTVINEAGSGHSLTVPALDVDRTLGSGEQTTLTVSETGTYEYVCRFHPTDMVGAFVVTDDPEGAAETDGTATETETPTDGGPTTTTDDDGYY